MPLGLFGGAAFVCPQFLHALKYIAVNNSGLRIGEDTVIFRGVLQALFQFVGLGVGLKFTVQPVYSGRSNIPATDFGSH